MDLTHQFLLSMPQTEDIEFQGSLVYVLEHGDNGAFGIVINQESGMALGEVFEQLQISVIASDVSDAPVLRGGPVEPEHGLVLHPPGPEFDSTRNFDGGVSVSSSRDILEALAAGAEPSSYLVVLGHAGWAPGQLDAEIAHNAWLTCEADADVIFKTALDDRRSAVGRLLGVDLDRVVGHSGTA